MYPPHIQEAAAAMGRTLSESATPLYGSGLRLPDRRAVIELVKEVRRLLFPAYFGDPALMSLAPENYAALLLERICEKLTEQLKLALPEDQVGRAEEIAREFARRLPQVQKLLLEDLDATFESDPAASSREEIIFAYPGLFAIFVYRIAHLLYCQRVPMIPRIMSEYAHSRTGIDIHPGASIGPHFFIDHGTGIVVGETTVIGRNVKLYQGVTLGAMSPRAGHASLPGKRHPTVGDDVTIYSGASILGGDTDIGDGSVVGGTVAAAPAIYRGLDGSRKPRCMSMTTKAYLCMKIPPQTQLKIQRMFRPGYCSVSGGKTQRKKIAAFTPCEDAG